MTSSSPFYYTNTTMVANDSYKNSDGSNVKSENNDYVIFEKYAKILIPAIFGVIFIIGLIGNMLVALAVIVHKHMRTRTNIFILSLAVADLCFIVFCVSFSGISYSLSVWPFGPIYCKVNHYVTYVSVYASVYTLLGLSFNRFLAVVYPISSLTFRTRSNAIRTVLVLWVICLLANIPIVFIADEHDYIYNGEFRKACFLKGLVLYPERSKVFFGSFFVIGYAVPLSLMCVLNGWAAIELSRTVVPGQSTHGANTQTSRKRAIRMLVVVATVFAVCWLPIQVDFMRLNFGDPEITIVSHGFRTAANALSYMNSCVNPVLYAFLSQEFRESFRKLMCCG